MCKRLLLVLPLLAAIWFYTLKLILHLQKNFTLIFKIPCPRQTKVHFKIRKIPKVECVLAVVILIVLR